MEETKNMSDHDLLITMHEQIRGLKDDIKEIKDGTSLTLADHETRLRKSENSITRIMTWGSAGVLLLGILEFIISNFYRK